MHTFTFFNPYRFSHFLLMRFLRCFLACTIVVYCRLNVGSFGIRSLLNRSTFKVADVIVVSYDQDGLMVINASGRNTPAMPKPKDARCSALHLHDRNAHVNSSFARASMIYFRCAGLILGMRYIVSPMSMPLQACAQNKNGTERFELSSGKIITIGETAIKERGFE